MYKWTACASVCEKRSCRKHRFLKWCMLEIFFLRSHIAPLLNPLSYAHLILFKHICNMFISELNMFPPRKIFCSVTIGPFTGAWNILKNHNWGLLFSKLFQQLSYHEIALPVSVNTMYWNYVEPCVVQFFQWLAVYITALPYLSGILLLLQRFVLFSVPQPLSG